MGPAFLFELCLSLAMELEVAAALWCHIRGLSNYSAESLEFMRVCQQNSCSSGIIWRWYNL